MTTGYDILLGLIFFTLVLVTLRLGMIVYEINQKKLRRKKLMKAKDVKELSDITEKLIELNKELTALSSRCNQLLRKGIDELE